MTIQLFGILLVTLCAVSALLTEAIKKWFENKEKNPSANLIAIIDAVVVGIGGMTAAYVWLGVAFTLQNILAIAAMTFLIAIGSMIGYDKVIQLLKQLNLNKGEK